jgi:peptide/nickel transport system substrate-binding protein
MKKLTSLVALSALATAVAANAAPAHEQGGTVTVPLITQTLIDDFNPFSQAQEDVVRGTMFEPLWIHNTLAGDIDFRVASGFEYGDGNQSLIINVREGVQWSDGEAFTAEDIAFSLNLGKEDLTLDKGGLWANGLLENVEVLDEMTVRLYFTRPDTTVDWLLTNYYIVPEHIWSEVEDKLTFRNANPVGTGMFTTVKTVRDNQIELCRNPLYFKADEGKPYLDCIKYRQYSDNSQIQPALMNDEIDWGSNFIADIDKTYVAKDPENHGYWYPANDLINIYLNTRIAPFSDINFRKAFSMALDRPTIVDLAAYGYPTVETTVNGIGQYFKPYVNKEVSAEFDYLAEYNPEAAKKLLADAGYKDTNKDGYLENPDGSEINFDIHVVNGWTDWVQTVQMVTEYLGEIGIKANTKTVDWSVYDSALKEGTYDASINWSATGVDPIVAFRDYFHTARVGQIWHAGHGVYDENIDAIIDEYQSITDRSRRFQILKELQTFAAENMAFVPVFSNPTWFQYNTLRVGGFPTAENPYVQPVFYDNARKIIVLENLYGK